MTSAYPEWHQQLQEPNTGNVDCTAYSMAAAVYADTNGAVKLTGRAIRLASDEPIPDPDSPGLNIRQAAVAVFKLTKGAVVIDHHWNWPFAGLLTKLQEGFWAELAVERRVLVQAGIGVANSCGKHGSCGHAILVGWDRLFQQYVILDPLIPVPLRVSVATMTTVVRHAADSIAGIGDGRAYYGIGRHVYKPALPVPPPPPPPKHRYAIEFATGASFFPYHVDPDTGNVIDREKARKFNKATSAPSEAAISRYWPKTKGNRLLARITKGPLKGLYVQPGAAGIRIKEVA